MACQSRAHAEKISIGVKKFYQSHPEAKQRLSNLYTGKGIPRTELTGSRSLETRIGGFWYGSVRNDSGRTPDERKYCELWNEDLKERIRAYWGYASVLSGKIEIQTRSDGFPHSISCHHVYYQKKSCCVWDEDEQGYYANINIGTHRSPIIEKYYIDGDPNKFVTLTRSEHKKTDFNKIHWIKTFEKLIEDQGGKCYFTKEDIENLLK